MGWSPVAVVFDCDGVLIDSEPIAWSAWRDLLAPYGVRITDADVAACTGRPFPANHAHFSARGDLPDMDTFRQWYLALVHDRFATELRAFEDVAPLLDRLDSRGMNIAVASSSPRQRLDYTLELVNLAERFHVSVAGDEVEHGKPAPDLFLEAARQLGVPAGGCLVVEDSTNGVRAGRAAGAHVVGVLREHNSRQALHGAHRIVPSLTLDVVLDWSGGTA